MSEALGFLKDLDLSGHSLKMWEFLHTADPLLLAVGAVFLISLGHKLASGHRAVFSWGLRLAALTLLAHVGYRACFDDGLTGALAHPQLLRSLTLAGYVLGVSWVLLPFMMFVYAYFKFGLAGFFGYGVYALIQGEAFTAQTWPGLLGSAALVGVLAMVLAWIAQPVWDLVAVRWPRRTTQAPVAAKAQEALATTPPRRRRGLRRLARLLARQIAAQQQSLERIVPGSEVAVQAKVLPSSAFLVAELTRLMVQYRGGGPADGRLAAFPLPVVEPGQAPAESLRLHADGNGGAPSLTFDMLYAWFIEEQARIASSTPEPEACRAKVAELLALYASLSERLLGREAIDVTPALSA